MYQDFTTKISYIIKDLPSICPNTEPLWSEFFHMPNEKCEALRAPLRRDRHSAGLLGNDLLLILCPFLPAGPGPDRGRGRQGPRPEGGKRHTPVTPWKENTETTEGPKSSLAMATQVKTPEAYWVGNTRMAAIRKTEETPPNGTASLSNP